MKTISKYILTATLILAGFTSFALTPEFSFKKDLRSEILAGFSFAGMIPSKADFDEPVAISVEFNIPEIIVPEIPSEATFEDLIIAVSISPALSESFFDAGSELDITALAPVTPAEATFEEVNEPAPAATILAPVVPAEATFEDVTDSGLVISDLAPRAPAQATFED